jgi:hypothetical protein
MRTSRDRVRDEASAPASAPIAPGRATLTSRLPVGQRAPLDGGPRADRSGTGVATDGAVYCPDGLGDTGDVFGRRPRGDGGGDAGGDVEPASVAAHVSSDPLIQRIADLHPRGITIALYADYDPGHDGREEFIRQARLAAGAHHAVLAVGDDLVVGRPAGVRRHTDVGAIVNRTHEALVARYRATRLDDAPEEPAFVRVLDLEIFCHGTHRALLLPDDRLSTRNVGELLAAMGGALHAGVNVEMFACDAASGDGSLAEVMSEALGDQASVFGHTSARHSTRNPDARVFGAAAGGAEGGRHMQDVLFPPAFVDHEVKRLWGAVPPAQRSELRTALRERVHDFYQMAVSMGALRDPIGRALVDELVPGAPGNPFGREMFTDPVRTAAIAQRYFAQYADEHAAEILASHPAAAHDGNTNASARGETAASGAPAAERAEPSAPATDDEREADAVVAIREQLPELAEREPGLRRGPATLSREARDRFRIPDRGWSDVRPADGVVRRMDIASSVQPFARRIADDPAALAHIRETLDLFYNDPDPRSRLRTGDIDIALVLAIANRESGRNRDMLLSSSDHRVVSAGTDTHVDGRGGLDYAGDHVAMMPSAIRGEVTATQGNDRLEAGLRANRRGANPAELRERDLLAAYIVEIRAREERFERRLRGEAADRHLPAAQVDALLAGMSTDAHRAWIQASFGSRLRQLTEGALDRFVAAVQARGPDAALADDQVNLNSIVAEDTVMDGQGLSGHRTRLSSAEAWMLDQTLPPELLAHGGGGAAAAAAE